MCSSDLVLAAAAVVGALTIHGPQSITEALTGERQREVPPAAEPGSLLRTVEFSRTPAAQIPASIAKKFGIETWDPGFVLEGGSIDVNGAGKLLTTEECLLSDVQARNPGRTRKEIEQAFRQHLGIRETIWLGNGIAGDDTHGHVDDLARFTSRDTVVTVVEPDKADANHLPLADNLRRLRARKDLKVATLPMPERVYFVGQRLPASYANFYIANGIVLVPVFGDKNDRVALQTLSRLFPDREVIGVYCRDLVLGLGTLHCMTQQQPVPK